MTTQTPYGASMWNERYAGADFLFGRAPNEYLRTKAAMIPAQSSVLCVADGEGRNSVWLAGQNHQVHAYDISEVGVAKALQLAADAGVSVDFNVSSCDEWRWAPHSHDAVVAIFIQFADPAMRSRLFANMARALRPGGVLILQGYTPKQLEYKTGGPGELSHLYTVDLVRDAFKDLTIHELVEYEAELNEGSRHAGRSALLGMVATQP